MWSRSSCIVCCSCPETCHDRISSFCEKGNIHKAFGKQGDMVDDLSGHCWKPKWEAKVVMTAVTAMKSEGKRKVLLLCISGGPQCDYEMGRQPDLARAIRKELPSSSVQVQWMDSSDFESLASRRRFSRSFMSDTSSSSARKESLRRSPRLSIEKSSSSHKKRRRSV